MGSGLLMLDEQQDQPALRWPQLAGRMLRTARAAHPGLSPRDLWRTLDLFLRQCARHEDFRAWHRPGNSPLQDMLTWRPSLVAAVNRPYVNAGWDATRRLAAIEQHYRQLNGRARKLRFSPGAMTCLATIRNGGHAIEVMLDSPAWFVHEGELTLNLFYEGERIYTLAFSLGLYADQSSAYIGALQGLGSERALAIYRTLTRHALHGLRPRDLLLTLFRMVCQEVGVQHLMAVGDQRRVSASGYFRGGVRVHSSYDAIWQEQHGTPGPDGFWVLPIDIARRSPEEIPSRKRGEYRHRYELLDRVRAELVRAMHTRAEE